MIASNEITHAKGPQWTQQPSPMKSNPCSIAAAACCCWAPCPRPHRVSRAFTTGTPKIASGACSPRFSTSRRLEPSRRSTICCCATTLHFGTCSHHAKSRARAMRAFATRNRTTLRASSTQPIFAPYSPQERKPASSIASSSSPRWACHAPRCPRRAPRTQK